MVPRQSQTQEYFYFTNYSIANPVGATAANPYAVDAATGTATFTPQYTGPHVVAYKVEKYDRATGKRVGFCNRDVQVSILQCSGAPPDISDPKTLLSVRSTKTNLQAVLALDLTLT